MKFAVAAVFALAFVIATQASILPWAPIAEIAGHGLSYTAVSHPVSLISAVHPHVPAAVAIHASPVAWPWHAHVHAPVVVAAAPAVEGAYVAKTRGAVHTAPLAGHTQSVSSINLAPAPGTA